MEGGSDSQILYCCFHPLFFCREEGFDNYTRRVNLWRVQSAVAQEQRSQVQAKVQEDVRGDAVPCGVGYFVISASFSVYRA